MKKLFIIIIMILIGALLTGCSLFIKPESSSSAPQVSGEAAVSAVQSAAQTEAMSAPSAMPAPTAYPTDAWPSPSESGDSLTYKDKNKVTIEYYDVAKDAQATATVKLSGDTSAESAMDAVNDIYIQKVIGADSIKTNSIIFKDGNIYIDFTDSIYDLNLGSAGESGVLESIANAYLNNVEGVNAVYYSVNGGNYSTGHIEIDRNQPYKTK